VAIARHKQVIALAEENEDLTDQLEVRKLVDRAKGRLMDEHGLSEQEAFRFVQTTAMGSRTPIRDVAEAILAGDVTP